MERSNTFPTAVQPELAVNTRAHWRRHVSLNSCIYRSDDGDYHDQFIVVMIPFTMLTIVMGIGDGGKWYNRGLDQILDKNAARRSCVVPGTLIRAWMDISMYSCNIINWFQVSHRNRQRSICDGSWVRPQSPMFCATFVVCLPWRSVLSVVERLRRCDTTFCVVSRWGWS